jgi:UDP-N-acetyl-D-glucosamine dehydrogenase
MHKTLIEKISSRQAKIGIIGMGYVGLTLAFGFAKKDFKVYGIDVDRDRVERLLKNRSFVLEISDSELAKVRKDKKLVITSDFGCIKQLDAVVICVPTPLDQHKEPDISFIAEAGRSIAANRRRGQLIILQSTTYPGTTDEILKPLFETKGFEEGRDYFLAYAPERVDFGNKQYGLENTPKIVGGISQVSCDLAKALFSQIINTVIPVSNEKTAEMVKLLENTFRLVNIGFIDEFMHTCERMGIDVWEVIEAASTKPYGFMPFYPGPGIGGHCIPVDPLYLSSRARAYGIESRFIEAAYYLNLEMPRYVVRRIIDMLNERGKALKNSSILLLGVAYKKDTSDLRESPALEIMETLMKQGAKVTYYDPHVPSVKTDGHNLRSAPFSEKVFKNSDCVVITTDHTKVDYPFVLKHSKLVFDTRNVLKDIKQRGNIVKL